MNKYVDQCPVCDMRVKHAEYVLQHNKMYYHFCSRQCYDKFVGRPDLYTRASVKKLGEVIKNRVIPLEHPLNTEAAELVKSVLVSLMGVKNVSVNSSAIFVSYDLKQVEEKIIEETLTEIGVEINNNWLERLRRRHIQQTEENELDNLASSPQPCCNRAPPH